MPLPAPVTSAILFTSPRASVGKLVLDVDANDLLEVVLGTEAELVCRAGVERSGPARDDAHDRLVGLTANQSCRSGAGDRAESGDLLGHGGGDARHRQAAPLGQRLRRERRPV